MKALLLHTFLLFLLVPAIVHAGKPLDPRKLPGNAIVYTKIARLQTETLPALAAYCHYSVGRPIQKNLQAQQVFPALCCLLLYFSFHNTVYRDIQLGKYHIYYYPSHHFW